MSSEIVHMELGERIRLVRQGAGMGQNEFAQSLGITQSSVSKYESGKREPGALLLAGIERVFQIDIKWLITGEGQDAGSDKPSGPLEPGTVGQGKLSKQEKELLGKALEVLRARKMEGAFDQALKSSIEALHAAVKNAEGIEHKQPGSPRAKKAKKGAAKDAAI